MNRREYLALSSGLLLTGCTSLDPPAGSDSEPSATSTPTSTPTETASTPEQTQTPPSEDDQYKLIEIGSRDNVENPDDNRPHELVMVNAGDAPREFTINITAQKEDSKQTETVLDSTYDVPVAEEPKDEAPWENDIYIEFLEPATYTIDLQIPAEDIGKQLTIQQEDFDCNWHTRTMIVYGDGRIEVGGTATTMGCNTPEG